MSKSWVIGDWAAEAERAEEEEKARAEASAAAAPWEAFPTLGESLVAAKPRKKKQQQTFSISELTVGKSVSHGTKTRPGSDSRGLTAQEMMMLPTRPRDRSGEEDQHGGLGGAFRDYRGGGDYRGGADRFDRGDRGGGYGGGYEHDREASGFLRDKERDEPSRADGSDDWSSSKRSALPQVRGYDGERRGSHDSERRGLRKAADAEPAPSRADEVENWGLVKKSLPLAPIDARPSRRNDDLRQPLRADEVDNWTSSKKAISSQVIDVTHVPSRANEAANWLSSRRISAAGGDLQTRETNADAAGNWGRPIQQQQTTEGLQRRPVVLAPRSRPRSPSPPPGHMNADVSSTLPPLGPKPKANPFGSARPREEVIANRGTDESRPDNEFGANERDIRPSSSHSSRPNTPEVSVEPVLRPRLSPFGSAKPREVLLQERGKDWRKIDFELEHRGVDRPETVEEIALKEKIRILTELSKQEVGTKAQGMNGELCEPCVEDPKLLPIFEELRIKERELQRLALALDDNVRFSQKAVDIPGSRSGRSDFGRSSEMSEISGSRPGSRPGSRSGRSDTGSNYDPSERPESLSGRRNFDASDRTHSLSGYGGGRGAEVGVRPWLRFGQVEGTRNQEALERLGSGSGHNDNRRSFESLQQPRWRTAAALPTEVGGAGEYSQQVAGPEIWTRADEGSRDGRRSWRVNDRAGMRRF